jgi:hypothetical protein
VTGAYQRHREVGGKRENEEFPAKATLADGKF